MSEDKMKRRRFLADILFAGGAISAAALLAKASQSTAPAGPTATPVVANPTYQADPADPHLDGEVALPQVQTPKTPEPVLGGKVQAPQPHVKGDVAPPRR
jgi:hypothetical protein